MQHESYLWKNGLTEVDDCPRRHSLVGALCTVISNFGLDSSCMILHVFHGRVESDDAISRTDGPFQGQVHRSNPSFDHMAKRLARRRLGDQLCRFDPILDRAGPALVGSGVYTKALSPVIALPTINVFISRVPS